VIDRAVSQAEFGALVGVSQQAVSELVRSGALAEGATAGEWLLAYCARLREQAAGRAGVDGGLNLAQERAALAREQRLGIEIRNATLRGQYAAISLLSEALATASQSVAERIDQLPAALRKACPHLAAGDIDTIMATMADARNAWVAATASIVSARIESADDDEDADSGDLFPDAEDATDARSA